MEKAKIKSKRSRKSMKSSFVYFFDFVQGKCEKVKMHFLD